MSNKINKAVLLFLASEIDNATLRSNKSFHEIANSVTASHPEITLSEHDWVQLDQKTKNAILSRVKKTLEAIR